MKVGTEVRYFVQVLNINGTVRAESSHDTKLDRALVDLGMLQASPHYMGNEVVLMQETITVEHEVYTPCDYTHSHTRSFCGNSACRES